VDVITFGSDKPRRPFRRRPRRAVVVAGLAAACAALLVAGIAAVRRDGPTEPGAAATQDSATAASTTTPAAPVPVQPVVPASSPCPAGPEMAGLVIDGPHMRQGRTLESCDSAATNGPWTVVVRRADGSLGRHGAVVTFPTGKPAGGLPVKVAGTPGTAVEGSVTWPLAGSHARIRGDLDRDELLSIASRTRVSGDRPRVDPPRGYEVVWSGPYRAPMIHEVRYGSEEVGEAEALGAGLTYTGLTSGGGGFEDQLYRQGAVAGGFVGGATAMVSGVSGGNATVAWEVRPGTVAYVGYSGATLDQDAIEALHRLAGRTSYLSPAEWRSTNPQTTYQANEPG
jgi:hypothetical protein